MRISVIGLGKLGICTAASFAAKGFEVTGVDINRDVVNAVNRGVAPVVEPGLQEMISQAAKRLRATDSYAEAVLNTDITFLIVPTPSKEDGSFSDAYLSDVLRELSMGFANKDEYHIFVITSTVSPGTTESRLIPLIENISGKKLNRDFGVAYNPEFIALGDVIRGFLNPDMVLIGESDRYVGERLEEIYRKVCENKPYIARMSIISAEITKIGINSFVTMKISFANTLANICENIPGASIDDITRAMGADRRISPYYLKGGLSYGGPCFPRDNRAFMAFAREYGIDTPLAEATDRVNLKRIDSLIDLVLRHMAEGSKAVSVLGLAYKPNTPVIDESPAIKLIEGLLKRGIDVMVYDPLAMDNARSCLGDAVHYASSVRECMANSPTCVITTQDDEFRRINSSYIVHNPAVVIDCWRIIRWKDLGEQVKYIALGSSYQEEVISSIP
ncbi:MAG TPA: UDP-glucose/GDP-mannose dehydrogenase family protein [Nitrospirae bacterium]|nr:UDP-glucose/GDP-mannose dehydrogenase family protein [Nitrospirota bacterium]